MRELERRDQAFNALSVRLTPTVAQRVERFRAVLEGLQVIDADDDDHKIELVLGCRQVVGGLEPVVIVVPDEAGGIVRASHHRDFRLVGEGLAQPLRGLDPETVAEHVDEKRRLNRRSADCAGCSRGFRRHEIAQRLAARPRLGALGRLVGEFALLDPKVRRAVVFCEHGRSAGRVKKQRDRDNLPCAGFWRPPQRGLDGACNHLRYRSAVDPAPSPLFAQSDQQRERRVAIGNLSGLLLIGAHRRARRLADGAVHLADIIAHFLQSSSAAPELGRR